MAIVVIIKSIPNGLHNKKIAVIHTERERERERAVEIGEKRKESDVNEHSNAIAQKSLSFMSMY